MTRNQDTTAAGGRRTLRPAHRYMGNQDQSQRERLLAQFTSAERAYLRKRPELLDGFVL